MHSRRKFLKALGIGAVAPTILLGQSVEPKRSRWEMIFGSPDTVKPEFAPNPASWDDSTITAAWIGHATVLINFFGTKIITDPVFSERIGLNILGLTTLGPKRLISPALSIKDLPPIDLILLSHAHMDHLDIPSLERFAKSVPMVIAKNTADVLENLGRKDVHELDWGEKMAVGGLEIEALQVKHFGWRFPWEKDRSRGEWTGRSYNAYLLSKNGRHIVFGGDTAYQEYFKEVGKRNLPIDLAIMPIGAYDPWIFNHANPEQAVEMANHLGVRQIMPIHWRTFIQSDEPTMEPITRFKAALEMTPERIALESVGQTWTLDPKLAQAGNNNNSAVGQALLSVQN
ncbi:MAG TPA: Zn-dependent hydrolase [Bacteroidetes bacterium]|nr:Zn-dependent hydrolase [Bacteroidota bacterium]